MDTKIFEENKIAEAAEIIQAGGLVAFPTETVYGLGADATNERAVKQVYAAKGRPSDNPLIVHIAQIQAISPYVDNFSEIAVKLMDTFWPGPLTLIFPIKEGSLSSVVTGGLSTAAFRMPNNTKTLALIKESGVPLVGPSANTSGKPSPTTAEHVFHDLKGKIAGILDDGKTVVGLESTVLDLSDPEGLPVILRPGAVTKEQLEAVVGTVLIDQHLIEENEAPKAPGMKYKHYAPNAQVQMISREKRNWQEAIDWAKKQQLVIGLLASRSVLETFEEQVDATYLLSEQGLVEEATQELFAGLRFLDEDASQVAVIFVETFSEDGLGAAYMNRLKKAANQKYFEEQ